MIANLAAFGLFVVLALTPTDWPVLLWHLEPEVLCMRIETAPMRMTCLTWDAQGVKSTEDNLTVKQVVAKFGL